MKTTMKIRTSGLLAAVLFSGSVWAAGSAGGRLAMPEDQAHSAARVMGMGSAVVALPLGSASMLWNPAGLGYLDRLELSGHHTSGLLDGIHEMAVVGMPSGALGGVAAELNYINNGTFEARNAFGVQTGTYTVGEFGLGLGWGKQLLSNMAIGLTVRWNSQYLASNSYTIFAMDFGWMWNPTEPLTVGATYANLGTAVAGKFLDSGLRFGASYQMNPNMILAASSELKPVGGFTGLRVGGEDWLFPMLAIRAGYVFNFNNYELEGITGATAGLGFKINNHMLLDYAIVPSGELGTSHHISFTYQGEKSETRAVKSKPVAQPPMVSGLEPARGVEGGGTSVVIKGSGFMGVTTVMFGDVHAFSFIVNSDSRITAKSPAQKGEVDVVVLSPGGYSPIVTADRFTYYAEPVPVIPAVIVIARVISLDDTFFDYNQSETNEAGLELLKDHVQVLKDNPELAICISGYTSASGTEEYNKKLSERRANSVRDALIKGGIDPRRLTVVGFGESRPANFEPIPSQVRSQAAKSNMRVLFEIGVCKIEDVK